MNFFAHQEAARAKSRRVIALFVLSVIVIVVAIDLVVLLVLGFASADAARRPIDDETIAGVLVTSSIVVLAIISLGSFYKTFSLRAGGGAVARALGGTLVPEDPRDFHLKRLRNVVEEMSIASGVPVPEIYVLDAEAGINAFAAGFAPTDAAVAVTRGALDRLSRDELQGVIAHEFSHILNGDMRLNLRLMGLIFGLLVLGLCGRKVLEHTRHRGSRRNEGGALLLIALAVMILGYLGVFLGRLMKAYISRQREFLADASAVQFTRLSHGLAGALMKIGAFEAGSKLTQEDGEEVAHMLFGDGVGYGRMTATHPPLIERIRRIDPRFDPEQLTRLKLAERSFEGVDEDSDPPAAGALLAGFTPSAESSAPQLPQARVAAPSPQQLVAEVANPGIAHVEYAAAIRQSLPPILATAARMRERAIDAVLALLLALEVDPAPALAEIAHRLGSVRARGSEELLVAARQLHPAQRLPLVQLALPALKRRPANEARLLVDTIDVLVHRDGRLLVFEYVLARLLRQQLGEAMQPGAAKPGGAKLPAVRRHALDLLATLARHGHEHPDVARRAYAAGAAALFPGEAVAYAPPADWIGALDNALPALDALLPAGKESLVLALATTIGHDGRVGIDEAELLRLTCTLLHCPLPPILG
ncbi:MAG: peptidase M48 Ste24p [Xanthomonadales bacterium PRO6]|nr:Protease HtpX [Xanthomonadales bacterium]MCE7931422.1 peptidase M48 Ste24p [Xanthomonadales bacterium PRO6]